MAKETNVDAPADAPRRQSHDRLAGEAGRPDREDPGRNVNAAARPLVVALGSPDERADLVVLSPPVLGAREDWPEDVPVVRYETDDEVVLFDPFLPPDGEFDPHGKPVRVLLTQPAHFRGTADFVERYAASVWVPPRAAWRRRPNPASTDQLPGGVEAIELDGEPQQVVFFIPEHATLVSGDVLSGTGGILHVFVDDADRDPLLASLDALGDLPIDQVVIPQAS